MSNQLGWVQFSKALDAGRAGARRTAWGADERPARPSRRDRYSAPGRPGPHVLHLGWALAVIAVVAVTIVSWAVTAGATPLPSQLAPPGMCWPTLSSTCRDGLVETGRAGEQ